MGGGGRTQAGEPMAFRIGEVLLAFVRGQWAWEGELFSGVESGEQLGADGAHAVSREIAGVPPSWDAGTGYPAGLCPMEDGIKGWDVALFACDVASEEIDLDPLGGIRAGRVFENDEMAVNQMASPILAGGFNEIGRDGNQ